MAYCRCLKGIHLSNWHLNVGKRMQLMVHLTWCSHLKRRFSIWLLKIRNKEIQGSQEEMTLSVHALEGKLRVKTIKMLGRHNDRELLTLVDSGNTQFLGCKDSKGTKSTYSGNNCNVCICSRWKENSEQLHASHLYLAGKIFTTPLSVSTSKGEVWFCKELRSRQPQLSFSNADPSRITA
ncbi:uncharacterized protein LOC110600061 isoform X4 [Manihot esculenta]|nr:uncharacterized protein LOC110600061 isoform X4 [Manihot esculenta]